MDPRGVDVHDGRLVSVTTDVENAEVIVAIDYYRAMEDSKRTPGRIIFRGVTQFSVTSDLETLRSHRGPGNVSDWSHASSGTTFIHLVGGIIAVTAESLEFEGGA
jgi:hypothetical protein